MLARDITPEMTRPERLALWALVVIAWLVAGAAALACGSYDWTIDDPWVVDTVEVWWCPCPDGQSICGCGWVVVEERPCTTYDIGPGEQWRICPTSAANPWLDEQGLPRYQTDDVGWLTIRLVNEGGRSGFAECDPTLPGSLWPYAAEAWLAHDPTCTLDDCAWCDPGGRYPRGEGCGFQAYQGWPGEPVP